MADRPGVTYTAGVSERKKVILDIAFRRLEEVFHPDDLNHLHEIADVVWGRNEPIPEAEFEAAKADAFAIVTGRWRHGDVAEMPELQAILEMGGRHPSPDVLDYRACFARNIRVLSVAPAFGPMVAEMALAMALAAARDVVSGSVGVSELAPSSISTAATSAALPCTTRPWG